jgi:hypothetical protein
MKYAREENIPIIYSNILNGVKSEDVYKYVSLMMGE